MIARRRPLDQNPVFDYYVDIRDVAQRLRRQFWELKIAGSIPVIPTQKCNHSSAG